MPTVQHRGLAFLVALTLFTVTAPIRVHADESPLYFETDIHPILRAHCFHCHGEQEELAGSLDLRLRRFMVDGGDSGAAVIAGDPESSMLLERIVAGEMPPEELSKRPTAKEIEIIRRWIAEGAKTKRDEPETLPRDAWITPEDRSFWSFQPIRRIDPPNVKDAGRVRTPIDRFVLAKLESRGFNLGPEADRETLIRRVSFDLLGLPPTPEAVTRFVADPAPDAYERLVDRLLASPHYGERWGRHWLDAAGYADSEGVSEADPPRPHAWRYRDFVIQALNANMPLDQFIRWQLAGDELVEDQKHWPMLDRQRLTATGLLTMAPDGTASSNTLTLRNEMVADTVEIVTSSLLGLTVACAQCHNHRYDPISQQDYYRLRAIFDPALNIAAWKTPAKRRVSLYTDEKRKRAAEIEAEAKAVDAERKKKEQAFIEATFEKELAKLPEEIRAEVRAARDTPAKERDDQQKKLLRDHPSVNVSAGSLYLYDRKAADELKKMAEQAKKIRETKPLEEFVRAVNEGPVKTPPTSFVMVRGDPENRGVDVEPQGLDILGGASIPLNDPTLPSTGRRLAYANWLTSGDHPLTARVLANRVWMHHFGRGIVDTPADFGRLGAAPSHPELLDWLAAELQDGGWNLKQLHRQILLSHTYRQSSQRRPELEQVDSQNRLLGRMSLRRLDAESLRDAMLAISGRLITKRFGQPVPVMADKVGQWVIGKENLNAGRPGAVLPMNGEDLRRSVYVQSRRSRPLAVLDTFDLPAMTPNCSRRASSTVATQSLLLMNGPYAARQADAIANRVLAEAKEPSLQLQRAWRLIYATEPSAEQLDTLHSFWDEQAKLYETTPPAGADAKKYDADAARKDAFTVLCQALLSSNGFLYVD